MSTEALPVLKSKIKLFVSMRRIISVYFMVLALLEVSMIGLLNYGFEFQPWTEFLAQESKDLLLAISLAYLFKLRPPPNITPASDGGSDISLEKLSCSKDSLSSQVVISYGGSLRNIHDIHTIPLFLGLKDELRESS
ncbi:hypothetical protein BKA69DRAFT_1120800 [Paraphysoderma sedebokerense]|nr:hypothetical protein BKA69DRAFT_1120800 [Paraphysoderma sedebokerense]